MRKNRVLLLLSVFLVSSFLSYPAACLACGHEGFYTGLGYTQLFMWTTEHQRSLAASPRIHFGPGYGAHAVIGYDFCGSRWGIQLPFEFSRQRLDRIEWTNQFGSQVEAVVHLAAWQNGLDVHLVGGVGWAYLTEGRIDNQSNSGGISVGLGPGLSYYFHRDEKISTALAVEAPFRMIYYFGSRLSQGGTTVLAFPIRLSIQLGF